MDFSAQWRKVIEKQAQMEADLRCQLQQDISAEFEKLKARVQKIDSELIATGGKSIGATHSEKSVQFTNTTIVFKFRDAEDSGGRTSSIQVTQGKRGPIEYFGVRSGKDEIAWQIASGTVTFKTDHLLEMLI